MSVKEYMKGLREVISDNESIYPLNLARSKITHILRPAGVTLKILTPQETIAELQRSGKSLLRFGDAEPRLIHGGNVYYQQTSSELKTFIKHLLQTYSDTSPYLLAVPSTINLSRKELVARGICKQWEMSKFAFRKFANPHATYGDSLIFYSKKISYDDLRPLWRNAHTLIVINHDPRVASTIRSRERDKTIEFIQVPDRESFGIRNDIIKQIRTIIKRRKLTKHAVCIIISGGIGAKAVVHDLATEYVLYDVGTLFGFSELDKNPALKYAPRKNK